MALENNRYVDLGERGKYDSRNSLNDLTGKEWMIFTKSWFIEDGKPSEITHDIKNHPASFPPSMIREFIKFFTKVDDWVLDPFLGIGSTLVACNETLRNGIGIELYEHFAEYARSRTNLEVITGDCREVIKNLKLKFELCITSPPYWTILRKTKDYKQQERAEKGLDLKYGSDKNDIGQIQEYPVFLNTLVDLFTNIKPLLSDNGHLAIIVQNIREGGEIIPFASELTLALCHIYKFQGERIWCQNQKSLKPYGYPFAYVPNIHHHYCLIFKKRS